MELVEKNILPVESSLKEAIIGEEPGLPGWTREPAQGPLPHPAPKAGRWAVGRKRSPSQSRIGKGIMRHAVSKLAETSDTQGKAQTKR